MSGFLRRRIARHWTPELGDRTETGFWMAHPAVRRAINRRITGNEDSWPMEWFQSRWGNAPFELALVPGCGSGELERDLLSKGLIERAEAFDLSRSQIEEAERRAEASGFADRLSYRTGTLEEQAPQTARYDACFFHQSLHHFPNPARALNQIGAMLKPAGLLYLDEYVGPSRQQWNRKHFALACAVYENLPAGLRRNSRLEIPGILAKLADPSESIASDQILIAVEKYFDIIERRDYGGFLLAPCWSQLRHDDTLVEALIEVEDALTRLHPTWHSVIVARLKKR
ncbi:MAG: class I SAM-dependent methyltransferase [Thermoanaerobaculia bacterium]|nr:class I SAM-dependent methyltransferase [Thermoanaerobaculia bacterium]